MDYKNEIGHLLQKYFSGTIMPDEQRLLDSWMKEKEEHKQLFDRLRKDTRFAEEYGIFREVDTTRAWETFRVKNGLRRQRRMTTWIKYAAVIALPLLIAGVWLLFPRGGERSIPVAQNTKIVKREESPVLEVVGGGKVILEKEKDKMIEAGRGVDVQQSSGMLVYSDSVVSEYVDTNVLRIPKGGEFKLQLADGTRVYLNSATDLRYPVAFTGPERRVYLKGEAYFEVAKDVEHPFIVVTDDVQVRVYGTSFNVNTLGADGVRTVLVEGKVGIRGQDLDREYVLKPNELAFYDRNSRDMKIETVDPDLYTLWRKGIFVFERETLENIMNTLSLWYDMEVFFQSESAKQLHFSGHMKRYEQIEDILHAITDATGVVFTINDRTVCVSR
ncbi:ferric-dicitrate binding protein FerR (iron transport regulator) [Butyricimonas faecihominis]|uniref:Ferric-dicitrate binding protein FerR (Iron transport regulator) n=2 Tax=Butyricimonas faecihominis TaxID=1472416 RepID=A0A7W6N000_9BACT|nr:MULTISPECIES: FecR family protein [Butyricimonas]MBB4027546.1 ferric-dicitrate binding protein FerR (iron transport regulator) [Butyricimonas faecihominis]